MAGGTHPDNKGRGGRTMGKIIFTAATWIILFQGVACSKRQTDETRTIALRGTAETWLEPPPEISQDVSTSEETTVEEAEAKLVITNVIAYEKDGFIWLINPDDKNNEQLAEGHLIDWSSDGQNLFYFVHQDNVVTIKRFDLSAAQESVLRSVYDMPPDVRRTTRRLWGENGKLRFIPFLGYFTWMTGTEQTKPYTSSSREQPGQAYLCTGGVTNTGIRFSDCACPSFSSNADKMALDLWTPESSEGRRGGWSVYLTELDTGQTIELTAGDTPIFLPDGQTVLFYEAGYRKRAGQLSLVKIDGSGHTAVARGHGLFVLPDSSAVAYYAVEHVPDSGGCAWGTPGVNCWPGSYRGHWGKFGFATGKQDLPGWVDIGCGAPHDGDTFHQPAALSPQGNRVALIGAKSDGCHTYLGFMDIATGQVTKVQDSEHAQTPIRPRSWAPDGSRIVITWIRGARAETRIVDADSQTVAMTLRDASVWFSSWSPDSRYLVYEKDGSLFLVDTEAKTTVPLTQGENPVWSPL